MIQCQMWLCATVMFLYRSGIFNISWKGLGKDQKVWKHAAKIATDLNILNTTVYLLRKQSSHCGAIRPSWLTMIQDAGD